MPARPRTTRLAIAASAARAAPPAAPPAATPAATPAKRPAAPTATRPAARPVAKPAAKPVAEPAPAPAAPAERPADEKISINLGCVDLGQIDLLVREGFYANRTDLIRTAIRNQLAQHADVVRQTVARQTLVLGIQHFSAADLRAVQAAGQTLQIRVLGLAVIAPDVTPELALSAIDSMLVLGALHASPAVKAALATRNR